MHSGDAEARRLAAVCAVSPAPLIPFPLSEMPNRTIVRLIFMRTATRDAHACRWTLERAS